MLSASSRRRRLYPLAILCGLMLCRCDADVSCAGCGTSDYTYPSQLVQGAEPVDDGMRARMTERGLDFIVAHLDSIITQAFPPLSTDPSDPDSRRAAIPFSDFGSLSWEQEGVLVDLFRWSTALALTDQDPPSYAFIVLEDEDGRTLRDRITADFVEPAAITLHIDDLRIGFDATARGDAIMSFADEDLALAACALSLEANEPIEMCLYCYLDWQLFYDPNDPDTFEWPQDAPLACSLAGLSYDTCCYRKNRVTDVNVACAMDDGNVAADPAYPGHSISLSLDLTLRPTVTNANCEGGAPSCIFIDTTFDALNDLQITDFDVNIHSRVLDANDPFDLCADDDNVFGALLELDGTIECDTICPVMDDFLGVVENVADFLGPIIDIAAGTMVDALLDSLLDTVNYKPLEVADRMAIGDLAAGRVESLNRANDLGFLVRPTTGTFRVNCPTGSGPCEERRGMDMVLSSGFEAVHDPDNGKPAPHPCVRPITGADFVRHYGAAAFEAPTSLPLTGEFTDPAVGTPQVYDVAASVALTSLNQAGFAGYNSGLLCLQLGAEDIHLLTNGAFALTAGAIDLLSGGALGQFADARAPALLATAPELPPLFRFGAGVEGDPHLTLEIERYHISLYVLLYDRPVRIFEVVADATAGLTVVPDPVSRELQFQLSEGPTIDNFEEIYNELLPYSDFGELLPVLMEIAFGALLADNIELSYDFAPIIEQALGVPVYVSVDGIETVESGGSRDFLNAYFSLSDQSPGGPLTYHVVSDLRLADDPGLLELGADGARHPTSQVRLVDRLTSLVPDHEYSYRVDGSAWRAVVRPDAEGVLTLRSGLLAIPGRHVIEVRGQRIGAPETREEVPQEIVVILDPQAPKLSLYQTEAGAVIALGEDLVCPRERLEYAFALDAAPLGEFSPRAQLDPEQVDQARVVSARARDEAGNLSAIARLRLRAPDPASSAQPRLEGGCQCAADAPPSTSALALVGLSLIGLVWRRRRR